MERNKIFSREFRVLRIFMRSFTYRLHKLIHELFPEIELEVVHYNDFYHRYKWDIVYRGERWFPHIIFSLSFQQSTLSIGSDPLFEYIGEELVSSVDSMNNLIKTIVDSIESIDNVLFYNVNPLEVMYESLKTQSLDTWRLLCI